MHTTLRYKFPVMMFLQFFIWGSWFVTLGTFLSSNLKASGSDAADVFSTQSWGAVIAPFVIGLIADRYFNAEKILGFLHLIGAGLMFMMYSSGEVGEFYLYVLAYMICFMPTLSLINTICFTHMDKPELEFSKVRFWGSVGWIIAGLTISYGFGWDSIQGLENGHFKNTFLLAGATSVILGLFSFFLPATPPKSEKGVRINISRLLGLDALQLLKNRNFLIFFSSAILICIPLSFYYQNAHQFLTASGLKEPTGKMALGQVSEAVCLLLIPVFFRRFGFKVTILIGMLAWSARYVFFAFGNAGDLSFMLIIGILLHGICYDFFFVSGQIYTNTMASERQRGVAQGLLTLATYGVGMLIGFKVAGLATDWIRNNQVTDPWKVLWLVPAAIALAVFIVFSLSFRDEKLESKEMVS